MKTLKEIGPTGQAIHWINHLFWMIGMMLIYFLKGNIKFGVETYYWVMIHLSFPGKLIAYTRPPWKQFIKHKLIELFGLFVTMFLFYLIFKSINYALTESN